MLLGVGSTQAVVGCDRARLGVHPLEMCYRVARLSKTQTQDELTPLGRSAVTKAEVPNPYFAVGKDKIAAPVGMVVIVEIWWRP